MLLNPFRPCYSPPSFQEQYRGGYVPKFFETKYVLQVMAPDTPYVAAAGSNKLYFIHTRCDPETAKHIKEHIEKATTLNPEEYVAIDEVLATAELKNSVTDETTFVFDPAYARVLFAKGMNRNNPELRLPEDEPNGDCLVTYDLQNIFVETADTLKYDFCYHSSDCIRQSNSSCRLYHHYQVNEDIMRPTTDCHYRRPDVTLNFAQSPLTCQGKVERRPPAFVNSRRDCTGRRRALVCAGSNISFKAMNQVVLDILVLVKTFRCSGVVFEERCYREMRRLEPWMKCVHEYL